MMSKVVNLSIFFPCFNDSKSIGKLVENANSIAKKYTGKFEIIVVDDASTDSSKKVLHKLLKKYKQLKVIFHDKNLGYGGALRSGFKAARNELIFYTDGDGQYDVKELPILLSLMTKDIDFVNGIKMSRHDPTYRIVLGNLYSFLTRWLFWLPIYDVDCDFRLIRKSLLDRLDLNCNSGAICLELVKKSQRAGAKFRQVSVHHLERKFGVSQFFRIDKLSHTLTEVTLLWINLMVLDKLSKLKRHKKLHLPQTELYNPSNATTVHTSQPN